MDMFFWQLVQFNFCHLILPRYIQQSSQTSVMEGFQAFLVNFSDRPYLHILHKYIQHDSYNIILTGNTRLFYHQMQFTLTKA